MSQQELARAVGTSQQQISRLESPAYDGHSIRMLHRLAHAMDADVEVRFRPRVRRLRLHLREDRSTYGSRKAGALTAHVIGGANGAGKSTFALTYLPRVDPRMEFVNADSIARGLSPFNEQAHAMAAGRVFLERIQDLVDTKVSFAMESTLAGRTLANALLRLKENGYRIVLTYLWIPSVDFSARRVASRVAAGGHDIPREVIRRRYDKSRRNLLSLYAPMSDEFSLWDSTSVPVRLVYQRNMKNEQIIDESIWEKIRKD
jgi:predicted ABC-type ATPase/DNA-binding XRE family transcriptional regulator